MSPRQTAPSFTLNPGETLWDFVTLGGTGALGQTHTFTIAGAGSVTASAVGDVPAGATAFPQLSGKDEGVPAERGLGLCVAVEVPTGTCLAGSDGEIGDPWQNIRANLATYNPSILLDFTGLAAGTTVESVTLASLQDGEGFILLSSTDGVNFSSFTGSTGIAVGDADLPTITIQVPSTTKYLLVSPNPAGGAGNNYLLASVTTLTQTRLGNQGCTPGYWKQSQHFDSWPAAYTQNQLISSVFTIPASISSLGNSTLLQGLSFQGGPALSGKAQILLRAAISAVLNSGSVQYGMSLTDIINSVNAALASGNLTTITDLATQLDGLNNGLGGCPLN